jgi:hypothetical protein
LIRISFHAFRSKRIILSENALLKKENGILLRRVEKKRVHFNVYDKLFFVVLNRAGDFWYRCCSSQNTQKVTRSQITTYRRLRGQIRPWTGKNRVPYV